MDANKIPKMNLDRDYMLTQPYNPTHNANTMTKVSVIVPVYGVEKYIEKCARSLFEQTMKEGVEFIFVDDCTPDNSISVLKNVLSEYPNRINQSKIIRHKTNRGLAASRNTGFSHAIGTYILNVDSDDWLESNTLQLLYDKGIKTNSDVVVCNFIAIFKDKAKTYEQRIPESPMEFFIKMLRGEIKYSAWNKLIRKTLLIDNRIQWIDGLNMGEDMSVIPRVVFHANKISHIQLPLYNYNQLNEDSYTHIWGKKAIENVVLANKIIIDFIEKQGLSEELSEHIKLFKQNNTYEIISHSPLREFKQNILLIEKPQIKNILKASYPSYVKVAYSLYVLNLPSLGKSVLNIVKTIKKIIGY